MNGATRSWTMVAAAALALALAAAAEKIPDPKVAKAVAEARKVAEGLAGHLKELLGKELAAGGFERAVAVCSEKALAETKAYSERRGRYVRRVTTRTRNPANKPDEFELRVLGVFERMRRAGAVMKDYYEVVETDGRQELRYLKPLLVQGLCLTCHGPEDKIPAGVKKILAERYPDDRATGYRAGELRGAISVRMPLEE